MPVCPSCAHENPDGNKFCAECGAALQASAGLRDQRKTVTAVFCDVVGSTALGESRDPEAVRELLARYFDRMRSIIEAHGGTVQKFIGDAVVAFFGVPVANEDDALRAVRAALEMRDALPELEIEARIGVNTGEVVMMGGDTLVTGDAVNVAARLQQAAGPGEVLLGRATWLLTRGAADVDALEPLELKGKAEPVAAFRLRSLGEAPERSRARFVGRADELALLDAAWRRAVQGSRCELVTVVGEPGVGKSRLAAELIARIGSEARTVRGGCLAYGEGISYWALGQIVRELAGIRDEHSLEAARTRLEAALAGVEDGSAIGAQVAQLLGMGTGTTTPEELAWAVRRFLAAAGAEGPIVVVVDDIQWAESALLELLAGLPRALSATPALILCLARPELRDRAPEWEATIALEGLAAGAVDGLLASLGAPESLRGRLVEVAAGNPLFAEELVGMLADEGALQAGGLDRVDLPVGLNALLGARLDRLEPAERDVLERGAIEGEVFHRGAVVELSGEGARAGVPGRLESLAGRDFLRAATEIVAGEVAYRFKHILVREAAYRAAPKRLRAALHEQFAAWLERVAGDRVAEVEEILGYHLEQAYRFRCELGPAGDEERALGERAAAHLVSAAGRAASLSDFDAVAALLRRALSLGLADPHEKARVLLELGEALQETRSIESESVLSEAHELASRVGEEKIAALALVARAWTRTGTKSLDYDDALAVSESAIDVLTGTGDDLGLARARRLRGHALGSLPGSNEEEVGAELEQALAHAEACGDKGMLRLAIVALANKHLVQGATPAGTAIERCEQLLVSVRGERVLEATVKRPLALFYAMALRPAEATDALDQANLVYDELNSRTWQVYRWVGAYARELAGDLEGAERALRKAFEYFRDLRGREIDTRANAASFRLAYLYCDQGRWDEAAEVFAYDPAATGRILSIRARLAAHEGLPEALPLAEQAAASAEAFPVNLSERARMQLVLAEVQLAAGLTVQAAASLASALALFELKGNLAGVAAAERRFADRLV